MVEPLELYVGDGAIMLTKSLICAMVPKRRWCDEMKDVAGLDGRESGLMR